jgi:hypothetical protein
MVVKRKQKRSGWLKAASLLLDVFCFLLMATIQVTVAVVAVTLGLTGKFLLGSKIG